MKNSDKTREQLLKELAILKTKNAKLEKNKEIFRIIAENTSDNIAITFFDLKAKYLYVSPSVKHTLGYDPKDLLGKSFFDFIHPDDKKVLLTLVKKYINLKIGKVLRIDDPKITETIEFRFKDKAGNWHYMQSTINFIGKNLLAVTRDITDSKKADKELRESEEKLRTILDSMLDIVLQLDPNLKIIWANKATIQLNPDAVGQFCYKALPGRNDICPGCPIVKALKTGKIEQGVVHLKSVTGVGESYWDDIEVPVKDAQGKITSIVKIARNITEKIQAEETLKQTEESYRDLFNNATDAIYIQDREGRFLDVNQGAVNMYGYPKDFFIGKTSEFLSAPEKNDMKKIIGFVKDAFNGKPRQYDFWGVRKNGEVFPKIVRSQKVSYLGKDSIITFALDITERKQAEEKLRESETRYKNLYSMMRLMCDNLPDLIWTKDMESKFLFVNKACSEILLDAGDTDEPIGKTDIYFADRMMKSHPEIPDYLSFGKKCVESDITVLETKKPMRFDESGNVKGEFLFLDVYKAPYNNENGEIIGTVGCARVVTKERQMEKILQESKEKFRAISESAIDSIFIKDVNLKYIHVNPAMEKLFELPESNLIGKTDIELFGEETGSHILELDKKVINGEILNYEHEKIVRGKLYSFHVIKVPLKNSIGKIIGLCGIARDITEKKQSEELLRESEQRFRKLLENVPTVAVQGYNADGDIHYWNKANESIYGYKAKEAIGKNLIDLIIPTEMKEDVKKIIKHGAKIGEMPPAAEITLMRKDGKPVTVFSSHAVVQQSGKEPELFCIDVDMTERKKAEEELEKHREHLEELVKERTAELEEKNKEMKRYNKLFEGREFRIKELRDKVKELEGK